MSSTRMRLLYAFILSLVCVSCLSTPDKNKTQNLFPKTNAEKILESFQGEKNDPETYQTIYLHIIRNRSNRGLLSSRLQQKLEFAFNSDGRLQSITRKKQADVWFYMEILHYQKIPLRLDRFNQVRTFRLGILVEIRVTLNPKSKDRTKEAERLLVKKEIRFDTNYSPLEVPFELETIANERLLDGLTDRIVYTTAEGWYSVLKRPDELNQEKNNDLLDNR